MPCLIAYNSHKMMLDGVQNGVGDFNYFVTWKIVLFINKVINIIICNMLFNIPFTISNFEKTLKTKDKNK